MSKYNLTPGMKFSYLTIESVDNKSTNGHRLCFVVCRCGKKFQTRVTSVATGKTTSCGCSRSTVHEMVGKRFGLLTVVKRAVRSDDEVYWECLCECGNPEFKTVSHGNLRSRSVISCGCLVKEYHERKKTHGMSYDRLYRIWLNMIDRCDNVKSINYQNYGGRGIGYHPDFSTFDGFYARIPEGYKPGLQLDRINNDGNYEPGNLRWVTPKQNARNRSNNRILIDPFDGERMAAVAMAEKYDLAYHNLLERLKLGWDLKDILTKKVKTKVRR